MPPAHRSGTGELLVGLAACLSLATGTATAATWAAPPAPATATAPPGGAPTAAAPGAVPGPGTAPAPAASGTAPAPAGVPGSAASTGSAGVPGSAASTPRRVVIPALGLRRELVDLGLRTDGGLEVPTDVDDVGRWTGGGAGSPIVLAGHVDSLDGPAVFAELGRLVPGDLVLLETDAGIVRHRVDRVEQHRKSAFPTFDVFAAGAAGSLRLVTCGGPFDRSASSYRDNVVVWASPVPPAPAAP